MTDSDKKTSLRDSPYTYATFMETSGKHYESWYMFIRYQGNEDALKHLQEQLGKVEWRIEGKLSTFDLELTHLVPELVAKEMTLVDLNSKSFHRKFDGKLQSIDLKLEKTKSNMRKIEKINDVLRNRGIENYLDGEDVDQEELVEIDEEDDDSSEDEDSSSEEDESDEKHMDIVKGAKKKGKRPEVSNKVEIPAFARAKIKHHKKHGDKGDRETKN